jgi:exonuclease V gamma subunit
LVEDVWQENAPPFAQRLIIVPNAPIKEWLLSCCLAHPRLQGWAGAQILLLHPAIVEILGRAGIEPPKRFLQLFISIYEHLPPTSTIATASLAEELTHLFTLCSLWGEAPSLEWQEVWKETCSQWTDPLIPVSIGTVALFGFSSLAPLHLRLFSSTGASCYLFSPCAQFWGDEISDKERLRFSNLVRSEIKPNHPLLANWGKLGRRLSSHLDSFPLIEEEIYPEITSSHCLAVLQRSILTLETPLEWRADDSIQIHSATSRMHEIEIMKQELSKLMTQEKLLPRDILVTAPDISLYAPFLEYLFKEIPLWISKRSPSSWELLDLLNLPKEQFALEKVIALSSFYKKGGFSEEEVESLKKGFKTVRIVEGLSGTAHSWQEGLTRLMLSSQVTSLNPLNRFLEIFYQLQHDLLFLEGKRSLQDWLKGLLLLQERYLLEQIPELSSLSSESEHPWSFDDVMQLLLRLKSPEEMPSSSLDKMMCVSLREAPLPPARVIWCLGVDEESFPRKKLKSSLAARPGRLPLSGEFDRYAFLEMVMKAEDRLLFSYERVDPLDGKEKQPSLLLEELKHYLQGKIPSIAHTHDSPQKKSLPPFFTAIPPSIDPLIALSDLKKCARSPLQLYFNKTLRLYLNEEPQDPLFLLPPMKKGLLRKKGASHIETARCQGELPMGGFERAAIDELEEEMGEILSMLHRWRIDPATIQSATFSDCKEGEGRPLLQAGPYQIQGELEGISPQGLLTHTPFSDLTRIWPLYLIYLQLYPNNPLLLFTKEGKTLSLPVKDPLQSLIAYLDFYKETLQRPCPWDMAALVKGNIQKEREDPYWQFLKRRNALPELEGDLPFWQSLVTTTFQPLTTS